MQRDTATRGVTSYCGTSDVNLLSPEIIDAFIEMELRNLPRADKHHTRLYEWSIPKGTQFKAAGTVMQLPTDVISTYVALRPIAGLPIRLWFRHRVVKPTTFR